MLRASRRAWLERRRLDEAEDKQKHYTYDEEEGEQSTPRLFVASVCRLRLAKSQQLIEIRISTATHVIAV